MMNRNEFEVLESTILENLPGKTPAWTTISNWVSAWQTAALKNETWNPKQAIGDWQSGLRTCWVGVKFQSGYRTNPDDAYIDEEYGAVLEALNIEADRLGVSRLNAPQTI